MGCQSDLTHFSVIKVPNADAWSRDGINPGFGMNGVNQMNKDVSGQNLQVFIDKMKGENLPPIVIDTFAWYYRQLVSGETGLVSDEEIRPLEPVEVPVADQLSDYADAGRKARERAAVIVLNGGLGTSMGLAGPKSLLKIKNGRSFLEVILARCDRKNIRPVFMNSFSTHPATRDAISKIALEQTPAYFLQHKFPKILRDDFTPATLAGRGDLEWNPPGHGDIYTALHTSGMLQRLLEEGIRYAFISNADNLGATLDDTLLGYFSQHEFPFMMEVAERTPADLKGGHLARLLDGRLMLREIAQCPADEIAAFQDIRRYRFFNTNSLWINLAFLKGIIEDQGMVRLPMIVNPKSLDPRDPDSPGVYQIETAMGAAVSLFEGAVAVKVPDSRFFPVKKCSDLLAARSDCFLLSPGLAFTQNPKRRLGRIKITLDPAYYQQIDMFDERFSQGVPSLVDCESVSIKGDVFFEAGVVIRGRAAIVNPLDQKAVVKKGTVIQGDFVL